MSLFELSHELGVALDPYGIAQLTLFSLMGRFGTGALGAVAPPRGRRRRGPDARLRHRATTPRARSGPGLAALAITRTTDLAAPVALSDWDHAKAPETRHAVTEGMALIVPLSARKRATGLIGLGTRLTGEPYAVMDLDYLATAAGMVGVAPREHAPLPRHAGGQPSPARDERGAGRDRSAQVRVPAEREPRAAHAARDHHRLPQHPEGHADDRRQRRSRRSRSRSSRPEKLAGMVQDLLEFSASSDDLASLDLRAYDVRAAAAGVRGSAAAGSRSGSARVRARGGGRAAARRVRRQAAPAHPRRARGQRGQVPRRPEAASACARAAARRRLATASRSRSGQRPASRKRNLETLSQPFRQGDGSRRAPPAGSDWASPSCAKSPSGWAPASEVASEFGMGRRSR